jgi:hypothetical protein
MAILVACIGLDEAARRHVQKLIADGDWEKVVLVASTEAKEGFVREKESEKEVFWVLIDQKRLLKDLKMDIREKLVGHVGFGDVGVNIIAGSGKEHMALFGALLSLGCGIRLVALTPDGVQEI